jgi:hypothetical protein
MKRLTIITSFLAILNIATFAQSISNIRFEKSGKLIEVFYDLTSNDNESYTVTLFCSQDRGVTWGPPLKKVSGEIGENIKPGIKKKVTWNVLEEQDKLVGDIKFKLEAKPTVNSALNTNSFGYGISYDLGGRGARSLPKPTYNSPEQGKIVVSIKVNRQGQVTYASAGAKGTTISEINLRHQAENTARKTVFEPDADAPEEQRGTITYVFVKQR